MTVTYRIETLDGGTWTTDGIGDPEANHFTSEAEAEATICDLRKLGEDWAAAKYRVVEVSS